MAEKKTCPGCHGVKHLDIVVKVDRKSGQRTTKRENCKTCNGTGYVTR